jgi:hypothetical protein
LPDNVLITPEQTQPQCPFLIADAVRGRLNSWWRCQGDDDHEPGAHVLPPNAVGMGEWLVNP